MTNVCRKLDNVSEALHVSDDVIIVKDAAIIKKLVQANLNWTRRYGWNWQHKSNRFRITGPSESQQYICAKLYDIIKGE